MENYNIDMNNMEVSYEAPMLDNISMESEKIFAEGPIEITPEKYYKEYITSSNSFFSKLMKDYYSILEVKAGSLYIATIDFYNDKKRTYKLYFKIRDEVLFFKELKILFHCNNFFLKKIIEIEDHLIFNKEKLNFFGVAFCMNNKNEQSLNFYFEKKKNRR